jgi:adenosylcobinamide-phosphate synthase
MGDEQRGIALDDITRTIQLMMLASLFALLLFAALRALAPGLA